MWPVEENRPDGAAFIHTEGLAPSDASAGSSAASQPFSERERSLSNTVKLHPSARRAHPPRDVTLSAQAVAPPAPPGPTGVASHRDPASAATVDERRPGYAPSLLLFPGLWLYRAWLVAATIALCAMLLYIQSLVGAIPLHPTPAQQIVQGAEFIWLAPFPLAIALWLGWFIFGNVARPDPDAVDIPTTAAQTGEIARPVRLVFRYVTRGDNQEVLRDAVASVHRAILAYVGGAGPYRVEVVTERAVSVPDERGNLAIHVVPSGYQTAQRSRFKARALTYLQTVAKPEPGDWYIYLDEESAIDESLLAGLYQFIWRAQARARRQRRPTPRLIGQGGILYQGGAWFYRGADALRTADDLGRFRLQYALGAPVFGVHGSFIVVAGEDDQDLTFDVGTRNSLTEDAAWALRAWARGYRFGWVDGYVREQPPQRVLDFVRQRARWLSGIRLVLRDSEVPLRFRSCLGVFTVLWQVSFLPFLVTIAAVIVHIAPPVWMRLPADFAWATFVLAYLQGADVEARYAGRDYVRKTLKTGKRARSHVYVVSSVARIASWMLACCYIWYALLEAAGVLYSLKPKRDFFVIYKPSLAPKGVQPPDAILPGPAAPSIRRPQL